MKVTKRHEETDTQAAGRRNQVRRVAVYGRMNGAGYQMHTEHSRWHGTARHGLAATSAVWTTLQLRGDGVAGVLELLQQVRPVAAHLLAQPVYPRRHAHLRPVRVFNMGWSGECVCVVRGTYRLVEAC